MTLPVESPVAESVSLRHYIEKLLTEADKRYTERFDAQEKALTVALAAQERAYKHTVWIVGLILGALQLGLHFIPVAHK